jgi:hypothetical protein
MRESRRLIDEIRAGALDSQISLADTMRKLVALGGETGSTELREWASRELRGYGGTGIPVPDYRKVFASLQVDAVNGYYVITGQAISPSQLPEGVRDVVTEEFTFGQGIGEIEQLANQARGEGGFVRLGIPGGQDIVRLMNYEYQVPHQEVTRIYWVASEASIRGVIDQIRTRLVELVAEMISGMPGNADVPPRSIADQAVNVVVHGRGSRVHVTSAQADSAHEMHAASVTDDGHSRWAKIGGFIVGLAAVVGAFVGICQWQGWGL